MPCYSSACGAPQRSEGRDVVRRFYQRDSGGRAIAPIDVACGMVGRFMTADVEELSAFSAALGAPSEAAELLDVLAVSWDGVMVATREGSGPKAWEEAGHPGGQHILNLRCPVKSGRREHTWAAHLDRAA